MRGPLSARRRRPESGRSSGPNRPGFAPGFTMRDAKETCGSCRSTPRAFPKRRPARFSSPTRSSGRSATGRSRTISSASGCDQLDHRASRRQCGRRRARSGRCGSATSTTSCERAHRSPDGTYRAIAARAVPGRPLGGFRYYGTRPDDPNDVVPHEHRRELRALKVFGAWTNLTDMKAGNTLDTLVTTEYGRDDGSPLSAGRRIDVRHWRQCARTTTTRDGKRSSTAVWC